MEIHQTSQEIGSVMEERYQVGGVMQRQAIDLVRRLNSMNASTSVLPPEVLSLIFQHVYDDTASSGFHSATLNLGHVSFHWRQVAWSTPQLWKNLEIEMTRKNVHLVVDLLCLYFRNVQDLPFSLVLNSKVPFLWTYREHLDSIPRILFQEGNAGKIWSFTLGNPPWTWLPLLTSNFSRLEHLDISSYLPESISTLTLTNAPRLHQIKLRVGGLRTVELPLTQITYLLLDGTLIDLCLSLLPNCPNITEFHLVWPRESTNNPDRVPGIRPDALVTLSHLERLTWSYNPDPRCLTLLQCLRLPALRSLSWLGSPRILGVEENEAVIRTFILNLPTNLATLSFHSISGWKISLLGDIFRHTKNVKELHLDGCNSDTIRDVFTLLSETPSLVHPTQHVSLPSLEHMTICYNCESPWECRRRPPREGGLASLILRVLEYRYRTGIATKFRLELLCLRAHWKARVKEGLRSLREDGFELEIWENSRNVDWLEDINAGQSDHEDS